MHQEEVIAREAALNAATVRHGCQINMHAYIRCDVL